MKFKIIFCFFFIGVVVYAGSRGPSVSGVTQYILNFGREDGKWSPNRDWTVKGLNSGEELKTVIKDNSGKLIAYATWNYNLNDNGDWSTARRIDKFGPKGHPDNDYANVPCLATGKYNLEIHAGGQIIWQTDFEIVNYNYFNRNHYSCTGPWKSLAYFYCCGDYSGGVINFWFEGPGNLGWYNKIGEDYERMMELKTELKNQSGELLFKNNPAQWDQFTIYPGTCKKFSKSVADSRQEFEQKVLNVDGSYTVIVYAGNELKDEWYPFVNLTFKVSGGKILINDSLSGETAAPTHRYITTSAYYQDNAVKNTIPDWKSF